MSEESLLAVFTGNCLSPEEKKLRLELFEKERDDIDKKFVPYLERINALPLFMTTQCCTGHGDIPARGGRRAHIDFRCALSPDQVIDKLLRPLTDCFDLNVELMLECGRTRYVLWLQNAIWASEMEVIISIMEQIQKEEDTRTTYQSSG